MSKVSLDDAVRIAKELDIDLIDKNRPRLDPKYWQKAMQIELEHGTRNAKTNITDNDLLMTGKIALAHINNFPDYYKRLEVMEEEADQFWNTTSGQISGKADSINMAGVSIDNSVDITSNGASIKANGQVSLESSDQCSSSIGSGWSMGKLIVWTIFFIIVAVYNYYVG